MPNLLPLESWRMAIGNINPWHFWGWSKSPLIPVTSDCNTLVREHAWQNAMAVGRSEIREAIETAEARLREHIRFSVGRRWIVETIQYPRPFEAAHQFSASIGSRGRWLNMTLNEGFVRNIGVETRDLIATATVAYSDPDGDGLDETFTITATTTVTDVDEIAVYFVSGDRLDGAAVSERWRIAPVQVSISSGTVTIKGHAWLLAKPILYEGASIPKNGLDPTVAANKVTQLEIYRHYTSTAGTTIDDAQCTLVWETQPYPAWALSCDLTDNLSFTTNSRDPAAVGMAVARAQIRDARLGEITLGRATFDSDTDQWVGAAWGTCRQPDRVIVRYEAGASLAGMENTWNQSGLDGRWDEVVARFATAELFNRICACESANRALWRWQFDLARAAGANDEQYRISDRDLNNPFGTRAGAVYAWKRVQQLYVQHAYNVG